MANRYERHTVGGYFATLLSDRQFDLLLTLMIAAVALNVLARSFGAGFYYGSSGTAGSVLVSFVTTPVTALCILFLIYVYFEEQIRGKCTWKNWNQRYSFQPAAILYGREYRRLLTGQLIHHDKFHLYLNIASLASLGQEEYTRRLSNVGIPGFACYLMMLTIAVGVVHVYLIKYFKHYEDMKTFSVGFSGVIFALKTLANYNRFDISSVGIPVFADFYTFQIPLLVPTFTLHFFDLFIVSMLLPRADFWGHLAGIVTGYLFAFVWNVKGIMTLFFTGRFPEEQVFIGTNRGKLVEQGANRQTYYTSCLKDFKIAHGLEENAVTLLCRKQANILSQTYPTVVATFSKCVKTLWSSATYIDDEEYYEEGYYENFDAGSIFDYVDNANEQRQMHLDTHEFGSLSRSLDSDPLVIIKMKEMISRKTDECSLLALRTICEAREFHFQELFRANYSLSERLDMMVNVEVKCENQAKELQQHLDDTPMTNNTVPEQNPEHGAGEAESKQTAKLQEKMRQSKDCVEHLKSLQRSDLEERIGTKEESNIKAHCAKQAEFLGCLGVHSKDLAFKLNLTGQQRNVAKCMAQAKQSNYGTALWPFDSSLMVDESNAFRVTSWDKESITDYMRENMLALVITLTALVLARRYFTRTLGGAEPTETNATVAEEYSNDDATVKGDREALIDDTIAVDESGIYEDAKKSGVDSPISQPLEKTTDRATFERALTELTTKNRNDAEVSRALVVMETLIVNATTKGQVDAHDAAAKKYRRVKIENPLIKHSMVLSGALDLMTSVGFISSKEHDGESYLIYPFNGEQPTWLEAGLDQMRKKNKNKTSNTPNSSREEKDAANKAAAAAALSRQKEQEKKIAESRERSKNTKFAAGMGGGDSRRIFYSGGT